MSADRREDLFAERAFNDQLIEKFRGAGGRPTGIFGKQDLLLLTSTGSISGRLVTVPLLFSRLGDDFVVVGSNRGLQREPSWCSNLRKCSDVFVEVDGRGFHAQARFVSGVERDELWAIHSIGRPVFATYQQTAERTIPVVRLTAVEPASL